MIGIWHTMSEEKNSLGFTFVAAKGNESQLWMRILWRNFSYGARSEDIGTLLAYDQNDTKVNVLGRNGFGLLFVPMPV
jgi:hypothetical protein